MTTAARRPVLPLDWTERIEWCLGAAANVLEEARPTTSEEAVEVANTWMYLAGYWQRQQNHQANLQWRAAKREMTT